MRWVLWLVYGVCWLLMTPFIPLFYLMCRLEAKPCPACGEKWITELRGEWGCEMWFCRRCGRYWELPYGNSNDGRTPRQ